MGRSDDGVFRCDLPVSRGSVLDRAAAAPGAGGRGSGVAQESQDGRLVLCALLEAAQGSAGLAGRRDELAHFGDESGLCVGLVERLRGLGETVVVARAGDYETLWNTLDVAPQRLVFWASTGLGFEELLSWSSSWMRVVIASIST